MKDFERHFEIPGPLVSVDWLAQNLSKSTLVILDATMKPITAVPAEEKKPITEFIPGARIFDFDEKICDQTSPLPHMMPAPRIFEAEVRKLGINPDSVVVVYDRVGTYSSPRAWWMLRAMGHEQVAVLNGGLPAWKKSGFPLVGIPLEQAKDGNFVAAPQLKLFSTADQVALALNDPEFAVLDARSSGRFSGTEPEPRAGLRGGHMPRALNLPFSKVQVDGILSEPPTLKNIFSDLVDAKQKLIFSCGSGVTACILALAAQVAGYEDLSVYDGSWCEWGSDPKRPVENKP